ncbi:hypothetical protein FOA52_014459 [Chlamydomonas sp. UWO 241]|nr:hypothetical protein FOA52_014459 [Chlamydomonas sp. UWO 241]
MSLLRGSTLAVGEWRGHRILVLICSTEMMMTCLHGRVHQARMGTLWPGASGSVCGASTKRSVCALSTMVESDFAGFCSKLNVEQRFARDESSGRPTLDEDESVMMIAGPVGLLYDNDCDAGKGTLTITTRRVVWCSDSQPSAVMALRYQQIVMHAISRDTSSGSQPCIYLQLDNGSEQMQEEHDEEAEAGVEPEIRLVPGDESKLDDLFKAMCDCAALNPDENGGEADGEGEFFFDEAEVIGGLDDESRAALLAAQAEGMELEGDEVELGDPGRFEDDDNDEEERGGEAGNGNGAAH